MMPLKDNQDVATFLVTKHSWKGRYKRVFSIGTHGITTYNPDRLEVTNKWQYSDVITVASAKHSNPANNYDFTLVMKKDKKIDTMKFSSEHKCLIITEAFKYRHLFAEKPKDIYRYQAYKHHWSGTRLPVVLEVGPCCLEQLDPSTHTLLASYPYSDIQGILQVRDIPGGFVLAVGGYSRLHMFSNTIDHQIIINKMLEMASLSLNISIKVLTATITLDDYHNQRFGKYSGDQHQTSLSEFMVHKVNPARHMEPMRRTLCLSDTCILERDPQTYSVVCLRPLCDVFALVRDPDHPQKFSIEYLNGQTRTYLAGERDALLASLVDGVRSAGQRDVHVRSSRTPRGYRLGPLHHAVDEETESNHLRLFQNPVQAGAKVLSRAEVIERFNANVGYSGLIYSVSQDRLFAENKEKLITGALTAIMSSCPSGSNLPLRELEAQFHALRRLCASKVGFAAFTALSGFREWMGSAVVGALRRECSACSHAALDALCALLQPMHAEPDLRQEQLNKASMLASQSFLEGLLSMWATHVTAGSGALVVAAMLDFLTFALCVPYSETTDGKQFDQLLEMVASRGRIIFKLFEHQSAAIVKGAGLVGRALVEEGGGGVGARVQALALAEAALPRHLLHALYTSAAPARLQRRHLARHLVALWLVEHAPANDLLRRIMHQSAAIVKGAGLVGRALVEEGGGGVGARVQALALAEAALPRHLLHALYTSAAPARLQRRHLARHLVALWLVEHAPANDLLRRIMPSGLLAFLESAEAPPAAALEAERVEERDNLQLAQAQAAGRPRAPHWEAIERQVKYVEKHIEHYASLALQHWAQRARGADARKEVRDRPVVLRRRRERVKSTANWPMFYYQFHRDHALPNLIWNHTTREELRNALENELRAFAMDREVAGGALTSWNHAELEVHYQCLQNEVKIGDYYLRILLEQKDNDDSPIRKSYEFFNDLYHRFLSTPKVEMKCMCLQAMTIVYGRYYEDIGPFADTKYLVQMLDRTCDKMERDRLVQFLAKLILHKKNVSEILEWNGIRILVDLMTLAHLHTSRAMVPTQTNVIEGPAQTGDGDREWYYNVETGDKVHRKGPVSFQQLKDLYKSGEINNKTKCWANSMEGWRALGGIPQLRWSLVARGAPALTETELAATILDLLIACARYYPSRDEEDAIIRPLPRVKKMLSEPACLAHVVQLLLTFDPVLVEKVATLLYEVMQDNPEISKLYLTGVFYFMLLYTGSNLLPIARFLRLTHMTQAFRADQSSSDIMQRSILGQLLPEAMVCYLENHGSDKFAQIFLGEWDTPEAIWNSEMRRMLIMKVSAHIGEFTPRLRAHIAARYPYLAIPAVLYPQLRNELFCNMFYLRHLCDTQRFPDWPIPDPVGLLKDVLEAWRREVDKKPSSMTAEQAYAALGLEPGQLDEAAVRKAYYRLAQQFHPDKNPEGRDRFEAVNQAYEFLCSRNVWTGDGPNTNNILLILRTQTILFQRYSEVLSPYKYAGYGALLRTARLEAEAEALFARDTALLPAACELAHATLACSALNAEELCRERGLEVRPYPTLRPLAARSAIAVQVRGVRRAAAYGAAGGGGGGAVRARHRAAAGRVRARARHARVLRAQRRGAVPGARPGVLSPYKYAGYGALLRTARLEAEAEALFARDTALLPAACELAHATLACSALNAEELCRERGLEVLQEALSRCVAVLGGSAEGSVAAAVCTHCARCFAVAARFPSCRAAAAQLPQLCADIVPLLRRPELGETACAGAEAVAALSADPQCRVRFARAHVLHALLPAVLRYDYTLAESGLPNEGDNKQEVANRLATQCVAALAALYGPHEETSEVDESVRQALHTLLTPHLCEKLGSSDTHELLKTLTSNWKTPYLVWDNSTRAELQEALRSRPAADAELVPLLRYSAHEGLLPVGGVYLDIYNDQPDFPIENPQQFVLDLLKFIQEETQADVVEERADRITLALNALANCIIKNPGVEIQCIGHFGLIFGLMSARALPQASEAAVQAAGAAARSRECVEDIAAGALLGHLLPLLTPTRPDALTALAALLTATPLVREALAKGAVIYLLDLFCNCKIPEIRETAVDLLARMMADKLHGPKVRLTISRYVPSVFAEAMREAGAAGALHTFDAAHEHPELVWGDELRARVRANLAQLRDRHYTNQIREPSVLFEDRDATETGEEAWAPAGEVVVGGVYLKLFLQNPTWSLRSPKRFLQELLTETLAALHKDSSEGSRGDTCARALAALLRARPALCEACAQFGELPRLARLLPACPKHAVPVLAALAQTQACVMALSQTDVMSGLKTAVKSCREVVGAACDALTAIFSSTVNTDKLVLQALESELVSELLAVLEGRGVEGGAAARVVGALKAMSRGGAHAERVRALLARSPVWEQYSAQRHDLFISAPQHHSIAAAPQTAGYLSAPPSAPPAHPPPLD